MDKPVSYSQLDPRWKNNDYSASGEKTTIGASGCGPTSMAMILATWADRKVTPTTECAWALKNGYKASHQGTYYGYFVPAAKRYGLTCKRVNTVSIYGNENSPCHAVAAAALAAGNLVIACMGKGLWTSSGHYVVPWKISENVIYINDPASTKAARVLGDYSRFKQQVKYYWIIEAPEVQKVEEDEMDGKQILEQLTPEQCYSILKEAQEHAATLPEPEWSQKEGHWDKAEKAGVVNGTSPEAPMKRDEVIAVLGRKGLL